MKSGALGAAFLMAGICTIQFSVRGGGSLGVWEGGEGGGDVGVGGGGGGHLQIQLA